MKSCGVVGLPNVGKSTFFNAITEKASAMTGNYPFCTIEPNIDIVPVIDSRLKKLKDAANSRNIIYPALEVYDIAGLVQDAHKGCGKGNAFLQDIQGVDLIIHMVRLFKDDLVTHVDGSVSPLRDIQTINQELIYADFSKLTNIKKPTLVVKSAIECLSNEKPVSTMNLNQLSELKQYNLLTAKPIIYALNIDSDFQMNIQKEYTDFFEYIKNETYITLSAVTEYEISQHKAEQTEYLELYNIPEPCLDRVMRAAYSKLNLGTYFTVGEKEACGWSVKSGSTAREAAAKIHSDIAKNFIIADVVHWEQFLEHKSWEACKKRGLIKKVGKDGLVNDGDVCYFHTS